jgi:hypothetical protein
VPLLLLLELVVSLIHGPVPFPVPVPSLIPDRDLPLGSHVIVPTLHLLLRVMSAPLLTCLLPLGLHVRGVCGNGLLIRIVLRSYHLEVLQEKEIVRLFL